jgi:hypothetical protein
MVCQKIGARGVADPRTPNPTQRGDAVRAESNLSNSRKKSSASVPDSHRPSNRTDVDLSPPAGELPTEIVDAILEIGNQRRQILLRMNKGVLAKDRDAVFECAAELVGLDSETPKVEGWGKR